MTHLQAKENRRLGLATEDVGHALVDGIHQHGKLCLRNIGTGMSDVQLADGLAQLLGILLGDQKGHSEGLASR